MKENFAKEWKKEKVDINLPMEIFILVNLEKIDLKDMESFFGKKVMYIKVNGKTIWSMDSGCFIIKMDEFMKVNFDLIEKKGLEFWLLGMVNLLKVFGIWMSYRKLLELQEKWEKHLIMKQVNMIMKINKFWFYYFLEI